MTTSLIEKRDIKYPCEECGKKCKIMKTGDEDGRISERWLQCICGWTNHPKGKRLPWSV